jgi:hypothetical protein
VLIPVCCSLSLSLFCVWCVVAAPFNLDTLKLITSYLSFRVARISPDLSCVWLFDEMYPKSASAVHSASASASASDALESAAPFQLLTVPNPEPHRTLMSCCALPNGTIVAGDNVGK